MNALHSISTIALAVLVTWSVPLTCSGQQPSNASEAHKAAGPSAGQVHKVFIPLDNDDEDRFVRSIPSQPTPAQAAGAEAYALFLSGKFQEALDKCRLSSELSPLDKDGAKIIDDRAEMVAGYCLVELGDDTGALGCLLRYQPSSTHLVPLYAAIAFARLGYTDRAHALIDQYAYESQGKLISALWKAQPEGDPKIHAVARCRHYIGDELCIVAQEASGLYNYQRAHDLEPNNPLVAFDLGKAYLRLGRYKESVAAYTLATKTGSRDLKQLATDQLARANQLRKSPPGNHR